MARHADTAQTSSVDQRREAAAELGGALREAIVALVATEVTNAELLTAASLARDITALLDRSSRPLTQLASIDDLPAGIRFFSPIVGPANPMAPPLEFRHTENGVSSRISLDRRFEGPCGYVHGGITALIFDEALGRAAARAKRWGMTASLSVQYHRAIPIDIELEITARVTGFERRKTMIEGFIALASDPETPLASATGLFIQPREETHAAYFGGLVDGAGASLTGALGVYE